MSASLRASSASRAACVASSGCCEREHCARIHFCIICPDLERVHLAVLLPVGTTGIEACLLALNPGFDPNMGNFDSQTVVVNPVLDPVELALDSMLRLLRNRHSVAFQNLQSAVHPLELEAEFVQSWSMRSLTGCSWVTSGLRLLRAHPDPL